MTRIQAVFAAALTLLTTLAVAPAALGDAFPDLTDNTIALPGFQPLYWDEDTGQLMLAIQALDEPFIYQSSMPRGVGSNDLGLDRGQLGDTRVVRFLRSGPKVLLVQDNLDYRADSDNRAEQHAVATSFARSVIWGFELLAESDGVLLVDATEFFLRDSHGLGGWLSRAQQGSYSVDSSRSAIYMPRTRSFPDNTEIEALVTFVGTRHYDANGSPVSDILPTVVPDPQAITVHFHHSFVRLPEPGYEPLPYDPRAGMIPGAEFNDYASEIGTPLLARYARRHRLERVDPEAASSPAVEPIIYYLDPGAPEPVRSALLDGAVWWNEAFEAAGFEDAFQVRMLPEDADPMDVRYNVIQWVHRSTRGWSYGSSVLDPRTGEIIKGHVTLGSLRVRQDYLIAESLLAPYGADGVPNTMLEMSLARIRQLSAHEVGHTLGIEHNFAASVNNRSSVMDYPHPLIRLTDEGIDLSQAYGVGIGEWDKRTVNYAYRDFPEAADAQAARQAIVEQTFADGFLYVADGDARNPGTAHPDGNLWDNGSDAIAELENLLAVRAYALDNFDQDVIRPGAPQATLEEALVPLYLLPRYQLQAVGKLLGGQRFSYPLRGDDLPPAQTVTADRQRQAARALLGLLTPEQLLLPADVVAMIPPRPPGYEDGRERFNGQAGPLFDPLAPAAALTQLTLEVMLHPARAVRMNQFNSDDNDLPGFSELLNGLMDASWYAANQSGRAGAVQRQTNQLVLQRLLGLSGNSQADAQVRAQALASLKGLDTWLGGKKASRRDAAWAAHYDAARQIIAQGLQDPAAWLPTQPAAVPPGSPIGG